MTTLTVPFFSRTRSAPAPLAAEPTSADRVRALVDAHWQPLGRMLRHMGTPEADLEDALQGVFLVAAQKLDLIQPGAERAYLTQTAVHMAARSRRSVGRRREVAGGDDPGRPDPSPLADGLLEQQRGQRVLQDILAQLPFDLHAVFVLYEIEEQTMAEIATAMQLPPGTVASRLRRARALFVDLAKSHRGSTP